MEENIETSNGMDNFRKTKERKTKNNMRDRVMEGG